jgi:hypothetical protein
MEGNYTQQSSFASLARTVATRWRTLEPELLQVYQEMAQRDRDRYQTELAIWTKKRADATKLEEQRLAEQAKIEGDEPSEVENDSTEKVDTVDVEKQWLSNEGGTGHNGDSDGRLPNGDAARSSTDEPTTTSSLFMGPPMKRYFKDGRESSDEVDSAESPFIGNFQSAVARTDSGMVHATVSNESHQSPFTRSSESYQAAHSQTPLVAAWGVPNKLPMRNHRHHSTVDQSRDFVLPPRGCTGAFASSDARATVSTESMSLPEPASVADGRSDGLDPQAHATGFDLIIAAAFGSQVGSDMVVYKRAEE